MAASEFTIYDGGAPVTVSTDPEFRIAAVSGSHTEIIHGTIVVGRRTYWWFDLPALLKSSGWFSIDRIY